jgi:hypothetical protein
MVQEFRRSGDVGRLLGIGTSFNYSRGTIIGLGNFGILPMIGKASVPESGTLLLLAAGLCGVCLFSNNRDFLNHSGKYIRNRSGYTAFLGVYPNWILMQRS